MSTPWNLDSPASVQPVQAVPKVVLDTNVVLDWLVFKDATCATLALQIQAGLLAWHSSGPMRCELLSVLGRPQLLKWQPDHGCVLRAFDTLATTDEALSSPRAASPALRCRDADDQKFIDLAIATGARWLFSRDRALLDLAKQASSRGVYILTPATWQREGLHLLQNP